MSNHIDLAKSKSKELESDFHDMKLGGLMFETQSFSKRKTPLKLKNRIRFQIGIISGFCLFRLRRRDQIFIENDYISFQLNISKQTRYLT